LMEKRKLLQKIFTNMEQGYQMSVFQEYGAEDLKNKGNLNTRESPLANGKHVILPIKQPMMLFKSMVLMATLMSILLNVTSETPKHLSFMKEQEKSIPSCKLNMF